MAKKKIYLLDTNVLIHNPRAIFSFDGVDIGIPAIALEQLDAFKREGTDRGRSAREVIRELDQLREHGNLSEGIKLDNGSVVKVLFMPLNKQTKTFPFKLDIEDNEILFTALMLKEDGYEIKFISKDLNARVKAEVLGIEAEDYLKEYVSQGEFYKGWVRVPVPAVQLKKEFPQELIELADHDALAINEFVVIESQHNPHQYRVFRYLGGKRFLEVQEPNFQWSVRSRNVQQLMAFNLLLDPNITFVTLFGPAGTGKTFLALVAGLHKVLVEDEYEKILIARPVVPLGRDIGYLPGTMQEKLYTWMLPIYDNMDLISHTANVNKHILEVGKSQEHHEKGKPYRGKRKGKWDKDYHKKYDHSDEHHNGRVVSLDELIRKGKLSLEAITYMRGRSIPYQFILIDEVQNLTPHEVKTLVSRVGEGSKIILAGDPYQIDSPYLDFSSNGLVVTSEKFKGQPMFGSVYLETSERSSLSQLAGQLL